jgi:hypothetical protein
LENEMKCHRSYKHIRLAAVGGKVFTEVDKEVLAEINRKNFSVGMRTKTGGQIYATVLDSNGAFISELQVFTHDFLAPPLARRREGDEIHHRDVNPLNNRFENLERKTVESHRALHQARRRKEREPDVGDLWRPPPRPAEGKRVSVFRSPTSTTKKVTVGLTPSPGQELALFRSALRSNFVRFWDPASAIYKGRGRPIPRRITSESFFDKKSRAAGIKPIRYGCLEDEASLVFLLALFPEKKTALAVLNQHLPRRVEDGLAARTASGRDTGGASPQSQSSRPGRFGPGVLERYIQRPSVWKALDELHRYDRLPAVGKYWHPTRMRDRPQERVPDTLTGEGDQVVPTVEAFTAPGSAAGLGLSGKDDEGG